MTSNEPVEMQCGKLAVRIARDSNDSDYPWNVQITRNGYQWSGNPCNDELLLMLHDAIEEVIPHLLTAHETAASTMDHGGVGQVGCEGDDGLLRVHGVNETCDVCSPKETSDGTNP